MASFGEILQEQLDRLGLSRKGFSDLVGCHKAMVTMIAQGNRRVPPDTIDTWADALQLEGEEREAFIEAGLLATAHPRLREHVAELRCKYTSARGEGGFGAP